ncbi:cuticle protein 8-like [Cherax quadricarinatus]|uniref:cuticle protein 8-like n=1 Tax=Cherax quadricarinatus TaxID=27406 RepID=UPI00387E74D5
MALKVCILAVLVGVTLAGPDKRPSFGPPPSTYNAPSPIPTYSAPSPAPTYSAPSPAPTYSAPSPAPTYNAPAPAPIYGTPAPVAPPKYDFNWAVNDQYSGNDFGHQESRDGYDTQGSYYVLLPDGRRQNVAYNVNGDSGFIAEVTYEGEAQYQAPQPTYGAPSPQPIYRAPTPQPTYSAPTPQPTYSAPTPQPTYSAPAPQPTYSAPTPQPIYGPPVPQSVYGAP